MGKYMRKTNRGENKEKLEAALDAIITQKKMIRETARQYGIHEATLRRYLKIRKNSKEQKSTSLGRAPVFTKQQEKEIRDYIQHLAELFFGITKDELCQIVFDYAERNNIRHNFSYVKKRAGKDWYKNFLKRHTEIILRKQESSSSSRILASSKSEVDKYFSNLQTVMNKYKFPPERIFNVDECEISTDPEEFGVISSGEPGRTITVLCAMSATGSYIPPLFVFPRLRMTTLLEKNGPAGAIYCCSENGRSNKEIFLKWLQLFQDKVGATVGNPVLIVLDNHASHISLDICEFCRQNSIVMVSLAPHSSQMMQPLDVTFLGPLKSAFSRHANLSIRSREHYELPDYDFAEIFNLAYTEVADIEKGVSGFRATGIFPLNPLKFADNFEPAESLIETEKEDNKSSIIIGTDETSKSSSGAVNELTFPNTPTKSESSSQPSTSKTEKEN